MVYLRSFKVYIRSFFVNSNTLKLHIHNFVIDKRINDLEGTQK